MSRRTELEDQISALIQQSNKANEDKLKTYDKAFELILKANFGISIKDLVKLIEADKCPKEKTESIKYTDESPDDSYSKHSEDGNHSHPDLKQKTNFIS